MIWLWGCWHLSFKMGHCDFTFSCLLQKWWWLIIDKSLLLQILISSKRRASCRCRCSAPKWEKRGWKKREKWANNYIISGLLLLYISGGTLTLYDLTLGLLASKFRLMGQCDFTFFLSSSKKWERRGQKVKLGGALVKALTLCNPTLLLFQFASHSAPLHCCILTIRFTLSCFSTCTALSEYVPVLKVRSQTTNGKISKLSLFYPLASVDIILSLFEGLYWHLCVQRTGKLGHFPIS